MLLSVLIFGIFTVRGLWLTLTYTYNLNHQFTYSCQYILLLV